MKWNETEASQCRYGDVAEEIWGEWDILWEDSTADWQGHASFLAEKDGKFCFYEWWYGSCSGCDGWEADGKTHDEIRREMHKTAMWFSNKESLKNWLTMLEGNTPISNYDMERGGGLAAGLDMMSGSLLGRINAIRKVFDIPPYDPEAKNHNSDSIS